MIKDFEKDNWTTFDEEIKNKKLILFGASGGCEKFIKQESTRFNIEFIVDNQETKWNANFIYGIKIKSPSELLKYNNDEMVILIASVCIICNIVGGLY